MQNIYYQAIDLNSSIKKEKFFDRTHAIKIASPLYVFEEKKCYKLIPILVKKVCLIDTLSRRTIFGIQLSHSDLKLATKKDR